MKPTHSAQLVALLFIAACGQVAAGEDAPPSPPIIDLDEPTVVPEQAGVGDDEPSPSMPLLVAAPRAATTPASLFAMSLATHAPLAQLIQASAEPRVDVVEQPIISKIDGAVELEVALAPPTGAYARVLVSDVVRAGTRTDHVLCEYGSVATFDPRCEAAAPTAHELPSAGPLTTARWKLWVLDEQTQAPLASCIPAAPDRIACVLPAQAAARYRIVASASGFADLWDGRAGLGEQARDGVAFTGAVAPRPEWQCWDWHVSGDALYCATRYELERFTAVETARLELDPIELRITANGISTTMASPALTWDAGNADLPGAY